MKRRMGSQDCGRSFSPVGPALLTLIPNVWVAFDIDGYWLHGCMAAHEPSITV